MYTINILPDKQDLTTEPEENILSCSLRHGIPHTHACGGRGKCSTCRIVIMEGLENCSERNDHEQILADKFKFNPKVRLACQTTISGPIKAKRLIIDEIDMKIMASMQTGTENGLGVEKEASMLFADIEGYTTFTENALAYDVIHMLNRYYFRMGEAIQAHDGIIMDYFGDGFLAIFGHNNNDNHAKNAVSAGLDMLSKMEILNDYFVNLFDRKFKVRLGIHSGKVIMGDIGITGMRKFAAIGDAVNAASRIETSNKDLGTSFLISESTYQKVSSEFEFDGPYQTELKGKKGIYNVYQVQGQVV